MKKTLDFSEAISSYDRSKDRDHIALGEKERKQITELFPRGDWANMPIEKYALGQSGSGEHFLRLAGIQIGPISAASQGAARKNL